ncbi:MAG: SgcJ/EcaC family oxidoreductase [Caldilinea sp.]|nr:SgcJ/EcaC family oxidoreductase [Caldilinea sp.]
MVRTYRLIGLLLLAALLLSACQPVVAQPQAPPSDEEVTAAVNAIWDEYEASIEAGDADRWGDLWVDDGVKYPPDAPLLAGKEAIVDNMREWMAMATANDVMITNQDVQVAGDFAFVRGLFRVDAELKANGMPVVMDGKYMSILQRQPDGSWKLYRDIFNSNVPPAAPPEPDVAAVTAEIDALFTEYGDSLAADDAERWIQLWVEDGVQLPPNAPPNVGRDVIFASISGAMEHYAYRDMDIQVDEVLVAGDLAIARGMYTVSLVPRDGSDSILVDGKYTTTFQRQADGTWKIYRDIFNSNVPPAPAAAPTTDVAAVAEAIDAVWREYEASQIAGDPDRWIALWAEDGVQLPPGSPPVVGKAAIDARDRSDLEVNDYSQFVITNKEVEVNGDLAFARGDFMVTVAPKSGGDPMDFQGKYMTIFRQQPDGSWKIYRDIFNPSAP